MLVDDGIVVVGRVVLVPSNAVELPSMDINRTDLPFNDRKLDFMATSAG